MVTHKNLVTGCILSALMLFFTLPASPQGKPVERNTIGVIKGGIKEAAAKTRTISSDFIQEKEMSMVNEKITSKGKFFFKKEKKLRWEYTEPFNYLIIMCDDQISIRDESKTSQFNVQSNKVFAEINRVILGSIRGTLLNDEKNFSASYFDNGTAWVVKLMPLSAKLKESLSEIVLYFDRRDFSVNRIDMIEPGGDRTRILFSGKKINQPVSDELFVAP
jgi:outer membrane lipoprotein-sorting protein